MNEETKPTEQVSEGAGDKIKSFLKAHRGTIIKVGIGLAVATVVAGGVYLAVRANTESAEELEEAYRLVEEAILTEDADLNKE